MKTAADRLAGDLTSLGVRAGGVLMVHSALSSLGHVEGGPDTVIAALRQALGPGGTLVMPAFRDGVTVEGIVTMVPRETLDRARRETVPYDPATTPTNCGAIPEAFRQRPGVRRSPHPFVSVCADGPAADWIVEPHAMSLAQGEASPFGRLARADAQLLLLGVGFDRLTILHHAEAQVPHGRRKTRVIPGPIGCLLAPDTGNDGGLHFPAVGEVLAAEGLATRGRVGRADCWLMRAAGVVARAREVLADRLPAAADDEASPG